MTKNRRNGVGLIYGVFIMVAMTAIASLAVDMGRVQIVKTQLRAAADAAARAAAHELAVNGQSAARDMAVKFAKANKADGTEVVLDRNADIKFWNCVIDAATKKPIFTATSDPKKLNAVQVFASRTAARNNGVPLMLGSFVGQNTCDVHGETIVMVIPEIAVNQYVPATANPFLAGMPKGTVASLNNPHNSPDYAGDATTPRQSPLAVGLPVSEAGQYTFDSIDGDARHDPNLPYFSPDGEMADMGHNTNGAENGIGDIRAPINALVGVFLSDEKPSTTAAPTMTDVSSESARSKVMVEPKLKEIFYIGDGLTGTGTGMKQTFVAPPGATRLFLATWDFYEWNNNAGFRNIKVNRPERIITVK